VRFFCFILKRECSR